MTKKRCIPCGGSGRVMGGGMMMNDCEHCDGLGKIIVSDDDIDYLAKKQNDKELESYKKAKKNIKSVDESITDDQAERILDDELNKSKTKRK
jgi:hypothetical protein